GRSLGVEALQCFQHEKRPFLFYDIGAVGFSGNGTVAVNTEEVVLELKSDTGVSTDTAHCVQLIVRCACQCRTTLHRELYGVAGGFMCGDRQGTACRDGVKYGIGVDQFTAGYGEECPMYERVDEELIVAGYRGCVDEFVGAHEE